MRVRCDLQVFSTCSRTVSVTILVLWPEMPYTTMAYLVEWTAICWRWHARSERSITLEPCSL